MMRRHVATAILGAFMWITSLRRIRAVAVDPDFEDVEILNGQSFMIDFTFTPQGDLIGIQKEGYVNVFKDPNGDNSYTEKIPVLDLSSKMCTNGERGLGGIQIHPNFESNRYIYLYYTYKKYGGCGNGQSEGPVNRLSRFVLPETNVIDMHNETVLFDTPRLQKDYHNGGRIQFGKDGLLYVSVGEGGFKEQSQNLGSLLGKMIRLKDDGSIPDDNPLVGASSGVRCRENGVPPPGSPEGAICLEIESMGLRNPFRFDMNPNTSGSEVQYYINDVGASAWEEINEGGDKFRKRFSIPNYGYPIREGPCRHSRTWGCDDSSGYMNPIHYYAHGPKGGAATGSAFIPNGIWSHNYENGYLYADFALGYIYLMQDTKENECLSCEPPRSNKEITILAEFPDIASMHFGPFRDTMALYYTSVAKGGVMHRFSFVGQGNRAPTPIINLSTTLAQPGMSITFNASDSFDPDGDLLSYNWKVNDQLFIDSEAKETSFIFTDPGVYLVSLTVEDRRGGVDRAYTEIKVGNPPQPVIMSPYDGATFAVGDVFTLVGAANDTEDGQLDDSALMWEVRKHHADHFHPFLDPTIGNSIQISEAPSPEDFYAATNSYLEIILTATNSYGIQATTTRTVMPKTVMVFIDSVPSGLHVELDKTTVITPSNATSWVGHELIVETDYCQTLNEKNYIFREWSDGSRSTRSTNRLRSQKWSIRRPRASDRVSRSTPTLIAIFDLYGGDCNPVPQSQSHSPCRVLMESGDTIKKNEFLPDETRDGEPEFNAFIIQRDDGNLVVFQGTPDSPGKVIWASGTQSQAVEVYSKLQGDGNLLTKEGNPEDAIKTTIWSSKSNGAKMKTFLALNCDGETISIYEGTPENPGAIRWTSEPL